MPLCMRPLLAAAPRARRWVFFCQGKGVSGSREPSLHKLRRWGRTTSPAERPGLQGLATTAFPGRGRRCQFRRGVPFCRPATQACQCIPCGQVGPLGVQPRG
eukprot:5975179-Amphidinium_carterae.3